MMEIERFVRKAIGETAREVEEEVEEDERD